ncbi:efflux RND transporter periplasmic adaptor subunit [Hymenobacter sp. PAMC 26628]|uniref:efflux RND transporter periplasmic adaptor subunit n=1 Tax=Hymenobacter sp. PAMC 26628 TaxID=1484118 RepID=UPI00077057A4|nr:efflux RND transporter periplasmic adaptor subunit [Hymenobacter sp. PAMC 26628]AMJ65320.1 hypothetical protein AXW84_07670 [Hymenobacter sp. PAMC 26628]
MRISHLLPVLLVVGTTGFLSGCKTKPEDKLPVNTKDLGSGYRTDTVLLRSPDQELRFTGKVGYDQRRVDRVFPVVSGNVLDVTAALGQRVQQGQALARVQSADVSGYQNDYNGARSDYAVAERNAANTEQLYKSNFASQNDLIAARAQLDKTRSALNRTSQVLKIYGGNAQGTGGAQPTYTVKAPASGFVVERNINAGMQLRPDNNTPLFVISDLSRVWVLLNIYESDVAAVKVGQPVNITALAYPDKTFKGTITNISNVVDADTKVLQARVELPNPGGLLKPDMFCSITLDLQRPGQALAVNPKSLIFSNDQYFVVRRRPGTPELKSGDDASKSYELVPVKVLRNTDRYTYVGGSLHPNDQVVTQGSLLLFNDLSAN